MSTRTDTAPTALVSTSYAVPDWAVGAELCVETEL
jgi:hypothetical protein